MFLAVLWTSVYFQGSHFPFVDVSDLDINFERTAFTPGQGVTSSTPYRYALTGIHGPSIRTVDLGESSLTSRLSGDPVPHKLGHFSSSLREVDKRDLGSPDLPIPPSCSWSPLQKNQDINPLSRWLTVNHQTEQPDDIKGENILLRKIWSISLPGWSPFQLPDYE